MLIEGLLFCNVTAQMFQFACLTHGPIDNPVTRRHPHFWVAPKSPDSYDFCLQEVHALSLRHFAMDGATLIQYVYAYEFNNDRLKKKWKTSLDAALELLDKLHTSESLSTQWKRVLPGRDIPPDDVLEHVQVAVMRKRVMNTDVFRASWEGEWDNNLDLSVFFALFTSQELVPEWLPQVESSGMIEALDTHTRLCKTCFKLGWPASPRDAVLLSHTLQDDTHLLYMATSVPRTADAPSYLRPSPPYVRAHIYILALFVSRPSPGRVSVTAYWSLDARGSVLGVRPIAMTTSFPRMLPKVVECAQTEGTRIPYVCACGPGIEVTSQRAAPALYLEYSVMDVAEHDFDQVVFSASRGTNARTICIRMSMMHSWDVRVRTQATGGCAATFTHKLRSCNAWIELWLLHAELGDPNAIVRAVLSAQIREGVERGEVYVNDERVDAKAADEPPADESASATDDGFLEHLAQSEPKQPSLSDSTTNDLTHRVSSMSLGASSMPPLTATIRRNYMYFTSLLQEPESKWKRVSDTRGVTVTQLESIDRTLVVYRAEATFVGLTVWDLYSTLSSPALAKHWTPTMQGAELVQDLGGQSGVWHVKHASSWPIQARDAVFVQTTYKSPSSVHVFAFSADEHVEVVPRASDAVRMQIDLYGWSIEALSPTTVHVTLIDQSDPRGWLSKTRIPAQMVTAMAGAGEYALKHGAPPCISRLLNARMCKQEYDANADAFQVEYLAAQDISNATCTECVVWCNLEVWAPNLDVKVTPAPLSISCLRRHRLAGGGGLWITLEHAVGDVEKEPVRVHVRKGPAQSRERGVVLVNGSRVHVDMEELNQEQLQALAQKKRSKPRRVPLDMARDEETEPPSKDASVAGDAEAETAPAPKPEEPAPPRPPTHAALDALALLRRIHAERHPDPAGPQAGWSLVSEKNGLYVHRRVIESVSRSVMVHRADKVVQGVAAEELLPYVSYPGARSAWDEQISKCRVLESYGSGSKTSLWTTPGTLLFYPRMFIVSSVTAHGSTSSTDDGKSETSASAAHQPVYFHATASSDASRWDLQALNPDKLTMGTVLIDGWIFENVDPYSMEQYAIPSTRCIHVVAIDYGATAGVNSLWNSSLPRGVLQLERWFAQHGPLSSVRAPPRWLNVYGDAREDVGCEWALHRGRRPSTLVTSDFDREARVFQVMSYIPDTTAIDNAEAGAPLFSPRSPTSPTFGVPHASRLNTRNSTGVYKRGGAKESALIADLQIELKHYPDGYAVQVTWAKVHDVCDLNTLPTTLPNDALPLDVHIFDVPPSALQAATHTHAEDSHRHCVRVSLPPAADNKMYAKSALVYVAIAPLGATRKSSKDEAASTHVPVTINSCVAEITYGHEGAREPVDTGADQLEQVPRDEHAHDAVLSDPLASIAVQPIESETVASPVPPTELDTMPEIEAIDTNVSPTTSTSPPLFSFWRPQRITSKWFSGLLSFRQRESDANSDAGAQQSHAVGSNGGSSAQHGGYQLSTLILFIILAFLLGSLTRAFVQPADFVLVPFSPSEKVPAAPSRPANDWGKESDSMRMIDVAAREIDNFVRAARQMHTFARFGHTEASLAEQEARADAMQEAGLVRWHEMHRFLDVYLPGLPWRLVMGLAGV